MHKGIIYECLFSLLEKGKYMYDCLHYYSSCDAGCIFFARKKFLSHSLLVLASVLSSVNENIVPGFSVLLVLSLIK